MEKIKLTRGCSTLVDDEDFEYLSKLKWCCSNYGYAVKSNGLLMHRLILNAPKGLDVDHINGDKLDNRRENLRICTRHQNSMNKKKGQGSSIYKGVYWNKGTQNWRAQIGINKTHVHIGLYNCEKDAAKAYNKKAKELFGEYAKINNII